MYTIYSGSSQRVGKTSMFVHFWTLFSCECLLLVLVCEKQLFADKENFLTSPSLCSSLLCLGQTHRGKVLFQCGQLLINIYFILCVCVRVGQRNFLSTKTMSSATENGNNIHFHDLSTLTTAFFLFCFVFALQVQMQLWPTKSSVSSRCGLSCSHPQLQWGPCRCGWEQKKNRT